MKKVDISRALRDSEYRNSLSAAEQALLPAHPAGPTGIADDVLRSMTGGCGYTQCSNCGGGVPVQTSSSGGPVLLTSCATDCP